MWKLLFSLATLSVLSLSLVTSSTSSAITTGGYLLAEYRTNVNEPTDPEDDELILCMGANFTEYQLPADEEYTLIGIFDSTSTPVLVAQNTGYELGGDYRIDELCANLPLINYTWNTEYSFRACALKGADPETDLICNADQPLTTPEQPTTEPTEQDQADKIIAGVQDAMLPIYHTMAIFSAMTIFYLAYRLIIYPFFRKI